MIMTDEKCVRTIGGDGVSIACYVDELPEFAESELVRLYNALHSSLAFFDIFRPAGRLSCYVASRDQRPIAILVFRRLNRKIEVLNEMIEMNHDEVERFAAHMFARFPSTDIISFKALKTDAARLSYPVQARPAKDTYVIELPETAKKYTEALGKSTRTGVRYQMNKVTRDHPSFVSRFYTNEDIDDDCIRQILRMSAARIASKTVRFVHDEDRIIRLAKRCGIVHALYIDGRICAGSINYRVGSSFFGEAIGQDREFEKYGLGKLTVYLTICECIARGGKKFYLGGGRFDFKQRMLGTHLEMERVEIYRSYPRMILHADQAGAVAIGGYVRRLKNWLWQHEKHAGARFVIQLFHGMRNLGKTDR